MVAAILTTVGPVRIGPRTIRELDDRTEIVRVDRLDGTIEFNARRPMQEAAQRDRPVRLHLDEAFDGKGEAGR